MEKPPLDKDDAENGGSSLQLNVDVGAWLTVSERDKLIMQELDARLDKFVLVFVHLVGDPHVEVEKFTASSKCTKLNGKDERTRLKHNEKFLDDFE